MHISLYILYVYVHASVYAYVCVYIWNEVYIEILSSLFRKFFVCRNCSVVTSCYIYLSNDKICYIYLSNDNICYIYLSNDARNYARIVGNCQKTIEIVSIL